MLNPRKAKSDILAAGDVMIDRVVALRTPSAQLLKGDDGLAIAPARRATSHALLLGAAEGGRIHSTADDVAAQATAAEPRRIELGVWC